MLLMIGFISGQLKAQKIQTPTIIPPSPTAQTFTRYGEIPVDYSTGVPSIDIPIYTVEGKQLKVPISISYHASGIKVNDIASEVGLGWALNAGGMVSRSVNGKRDETKSGTRTFLNSQSLLNKIRAEADYYDISTGNLDSIIYYEDFLENGFVVEDNMSDRYFYKLPNGGSGVFTYNYNYPSADSLITLPYRPLKVEKFISGTSTAAIIDSVKIIDENGITYVFKSYLTVATQNTSEWFITRMISADKTDTIKFTYAPQADYLTVNQTNHAYNGPAKNTLSSCLPENPTSFLSTSFSPLGSFKTPVLESITSSTAIVKFEYSTRNDFSDLKRLAQITIIPASSLTDTLKWVRLIPKYFGSTNEDRRLGLDSVLVGAPGSNQPQVYSLAYESQVLPPYPFKMTSPRYYEDYWGYYNDNTSSNNTSLVPLDFITNSFDKTAYGGNREADATTNYYYSKASMLKEIKYPTGGRTVFEFERHYATNAYPYKTSTGGYIGGFRVRSITNYTDSVNVATVKTYGYNQPVFRVIKKEYFSYDQSTIAKRTSVGPPPDYITTNCWSPATREIVLGDAILPLEVAPGMPIMYRKVVEYNGTVSNHAGKIEYSYNWPYSPSDYYSIPDHPFEFEWEWFYHPYHYDKGNYVPELLSKAIYSFDGTSYHPVTREDYDYTQLFTKTYNTGIKFTRLKQFLDYTYFVVPCPYAPPSCGIQGVIDEYLESLVAVDTKAYQEASLLTNSKTYTYNPLDSTKYVLTNTDFTYKESNLGIAEKKILSSKGDTLKTFYKYPVDFSGTTVYDAMVSRNILKPTIEEQLYTNGNFLQSTKSNYDFWNGSAWSVTATNLPVLKTVDTKILSDLSFRTRLRYHNYDANGNVLSVSNENDQKVSYIWDYNNSYPIAQIMNASVGDVAYTSFEMDGKGNWAYSGASTPESSSPTGRKVFTIVNSSNNITKSGLSTSTTYIVSYWKKSGTVAVNGTTPVTGRSVNGWTYYEHVVVNPSGGLITVSGTNGLIDELRLYPAAAQMTTSTYDPLVGITTQCDAINRITYYEYDVFKRLAVIRDQDKMILKKYCYNYIGQTENCTVFYNVSKSGTFTRNNCGSGYTGSSVTYTVAANMYAASSQAAADALAQADVDANGQAYANVNGTCTIICNSGNCSGESKKCVNGVCETGIRVNTDTYYNGTQWVCTYHYEWSDGSWSINYTSYGSKACPL
ncbi:MAG TPA: DUF5977 domain-containing protein [Chitinophagaceae bacterium]|nr:DUF5977 domain-containing protein [Chitinophagaceae bacterium]